MEHQEANTRESWARHNIQEGADAESVGQRYVLSIIDTGQMDNPVTISIEVEDGKFRRLSAEDQLGNKYKVGFFISKQARDQQPLWTAACDTERDGDGKADKDECQYCYVQDGRLKCVTVPCLEQE
jgi:hypothetical protein